MNEPLRIYIAAPYNPYDCKPHSAIQQAQRNVDRVIEAANYIHDIGHYAFVPHLSHYLHTHYSCKSDRGNWYYHYDNTFLDLWANAFLYLMTSPGADEELKRFKVRCIRESSKTNTMPVFCDIKSIPVLTEAK